MLPAASRSAPGWPRWSLAAGALVELSTVASGALAAHLPDAVLSPAHRAMMREAVQVQGWHGFALLVCGLLAERGGGQPAGRLLAASAAGFAAGTVLFAGGVDALALGGDRPVVRLLGHAAPVGGTVLMLSWLVLAAAALFRRPVPGC